MESKGQRENTRKTKDMRCQMSKGQAEVSGKHPCSVCRKVVGHKSICVLRVTVGFIKGVMESQAD